MSVMAICVKSVITSHSCNEFPSEKII